MCLWAHILLLLSLDICISWSVQYQSAIGSAIVIMTYSMLLPGVELSVSVLGLQTSSASQVSTLLKGIYRHISLTFDFSALNQRLYRGTDCFSQVEPIMLRLLPPKSTTKVIGHLGFRSVCGRCDEFVTQVWRIKWTWSLRRWSVISVWSYRQTNESLGVS